MTRMIETDFIPWQILAGLDRRVLPGPHRAHLMATAFSSDLVLPTRGTP